MWNLKWIWSGREWGFLDSDPSQENVLNKILKFWYKNTLKLIKIGFKDKKKEKIDFVSSFYQVNANIFESNFYEFILK